MNIFSLLRAWFHTKWKYIPLPWQPIAHQKKQSNTCYSICACIDRLKQKYRQNVHKSFKKAKMGLEDRQGQGVGMGQAGVGSHGKQW